MQVSKNVDFVDPAAANGIPRETPGSSRTLTTNLVPKRKGIAKKSLVRLMGFLRDTLFAAQCIPPGLEILDCSMHDVGSQHPIRIRV